MAIWQFSLDFIPRLKLIEYFGTIPKILDEDVQCENSFEEGVILPKAYEQILDLLGSSEKLTWIEDTWSWGDYNKGSHLTISRPNTVKASVFSRLDVTDWDEAFGRVVLNFSLLCDCVLLTGNKTVIEPEFNWLVEEVKRSNSYRFARNPVAYLQSDEVKRLNEEIRDKITDE
jgi:hypothetical protein